MKKVTIKIKKRKVRDEKIKDMISTTGGVTRVFKDKKKSLKADKAQRKQKHRGKNDDAM